MQVSDWLASAQGAPTTLPDEIAGLELAGVCEHNAEARPGYAFMAVAPDAASARAHALDAVGRGAALVLGAQPLNLPSQVPFVAIGDLLDRRGELASAFYHNPGAAMQCVGVTGTNGKTSVACYLAQLSCALGVRAGYGGTLGWGIPPAYAAGELTTPNAVALQRELAGLRDAGAERAMLEISSHALAQRRADAVPMRYGVFTNLSRDHLDYHGDMAAYGAAKARLFQDWPLDAAVINIDDEFGASLAERLRTSDEHDVTLVTCGAQGDWRWHARPSAIGLAVEWQLPGGRIQADLPLAADFAVANVTAALAVLAHMGHAPQALEAALAALPQVPGRMEIVAGGPGQALVVVDYAHTPDALEHALAALRTRCAGRLICVFGCGGDRDRGKRPLMGEIATRLADVVGVTSDNPRSEDPDAIIDDIMSGAGQTAAESFVRVDRAEAICTAVRLAQAADVVLIAGKGHEPYQETATGRADFDDRVVAREAVRRMSGGVH